MNRSLRSPTGGSPIKNGVFGKFLERAAAERGRGPAEGRPRQLGSAGGSHASSGPKPARFGVARRGHQEGAVGAQATSPGADRERTG